MIQGDPQAEKTPRFNFDIEAALKSIDTPETPLDVLFSNALRLATENIKKRTLFNLDNKKVILKGVRVYVCKNLLNYQSDLYQIVDNLGGDFSWFYSQAPTNIDYSSRLVVESVAKRNREQIRKKLV